MDRFDAHLDRIAKRAREDRPPQVDVGDQVLARLAEAQVPGSDTPIAVFALVSCAAAVAVVALSAYSVYSALDPFEALLQVTPVLIN